MIGIFNHSDLDHALDRLQREDPSLKVRIDPDSGQVRIYYPALEGREGRHSYDLD